MSELRLGIDIGGTFTDVLLVDENKVLITLKTPSTPSTPEKAIFNALKELKKSGVKLDTIGSFIHGTTLGVNTLIERNGTKTGLLVTEGFRDVLEMGRLRLENTTDLYGSKITPLVERNLVMEITERTLSNGEILKEVDEEQLFNSVQELQKNGVKTIAISFLHSYKNPINEQKAKEFLSAKFPNLFICTSSEVWPQQKEYERTLVTVMNAYIGEKMETYFTNLIKGAHELGLKANVLSTMSNGGIMTALKAAEEPVKTLLSGPASGVIGASYIASKMGIDKIITFDMGGTSVDIAAIDGKPSYSTENKVGDFQVIIPAIDVTAIGAGGGSIAWLDGAGVLKVGPKSAGSFPGPVCFNFGGMEPTLTDAYVELGIIRPEQFLSGEMDIYPELSTNSLSQLGQKLGLKSHQVAEAILEVATSNMYAQFIPLMARRGFDPRDFSLFAYGGAGPTHAFILAKEVGIGKVIVPPSPGTLSAMGSAYADLKKDFIKTIYKTEKELEEKELIQVFEELQDMGSEWMQKEVESGIKLDQIYYVFSADIRYSGQSFELEILISKEDMNDIPKVKKLFNAEYRSLFGVELPDEDIAFINLRSTIVGVTQKSNSLSFDEIIPSNQERLTREIFFEGKWQTVHVIERSQIQSGEVTPGPAIITSYDTTIFIPSDYNFYRDNLGNLVGELQSSE